MLADKHVLRTGVGRAGNGRRAVGGCAGMPPGNKHGSASQLHSRPAQTALFTRNRDSTQQGSCPELAHGDRPASQPAAAHTAARPPSSASAASARTGGSLSSCVIMMPSSSCCAACDRMRQPTQLVTCRRQANQGRAGLCVGEGAGRLPDVRLRPRGAWSLHLGMPQARMRRYLTAGSWLAVRR